MPPGEVYNANTSCTASINVNKGANTFAYAQVYAFSQTPPTITRRNLDKNGGII